MSLGVGDTLPSFVEFIRANRDWLFSGLGITIGGLLLIFGKAAYQGLRGRRPPDLRLKVMGAISYHPLVGSENYLAITVQNHSSFPAFIAGFFIELSGRQKLMVERDAITGAFQGKQELAPGDSRDFHVAVAHLREYINEPGHSAADFRRAFVVDAVGRGGVRNFV
jgi:hypothetical protein